MKEITALIRPNKVDETKKALAEAGFPAFTGRSVHGRGKASVDVMSENVVIAKTGMVQKRMMIIAAEDADVDKIVQIIINVNHTGMPGDGKIYVVPITSTYRVSKGIRVNNL